MSLNGRNLAVVSASDLNILSVRLHGDVIGPEFANLDVSGGLYGEGEKSTSLTWVADQEIAPGDEVEVALLDTASTSHAGKTIEELYPEEEQPMGPWPTLEMAFRQIAEQPKVRDGFSFRVVPPDGGPIQYRMEEIEKRVGGTDYASFLLHVGQSVKIRVD